MNTKKKELLTIYTLSALFSGGRLFVGAISVLYVLSYGVSIGEFAIIKSAQVAIFMFFDIPSGLLIKRIGYRKALLISFAFSIFGLFFYILGTSFLSFLCAEFILAISLCIYPVAFADYIMEFLNRHPEILIEKVFHRNEMYTNISNIITGALGGYLFTFQNTIPYGAGILMQGIGLYIVYKMVLQNSLIEKKSLNNKDFIKNSFKQLSLTRIGISIPIFLLFIIQLTIQPLYHFWQPLFYEINSQISGTMLGFLFMSYSLCAIILNYIFSKLVYLKFFRSIDCVLLLLFISSGLYFLTGLTKDEITAFFAFSCLQGLLFTALTCLSAIMNKTIDNENRPVVLKVISFLSRIGMLLSFAYIQIFAFLDEKSEAYREIHSLYLQFSNILLVAVIFVTLIYQYLQYKKNVKVTYENSST